MNRAVEQGKGMEPSWALQGNVVTYVMLLS